MKIKFTIMGLLLSPPGFAALFNSSSIDEYQSSDRGYYIASTKSSSSNNLLAYTCTKKLGRKYGGGGFSITDNLNPNDNDDQIETDFARWVFDKEKLIVTKLREKFRAGDYSWRRMHKRIFKELGIESERGYINELLNSAAVSYIKKDKEIAPFLLSSSNTKAKIYFKKTGQIITANFDLTSFSDSAIKSAFKGSCKPIMDIVGKNPKLATKYRALIEKEAKRIDLYKQTKAIESDKQRKAVEAARKKTEVETKAAARQLELETQYQSEQDLTEKQLVMAAIQQKVDRNWLRPPGTTQNLSCEVRVRLGANGSVLLVNITKSSGNIGFDRSVESAVSKADPLPMPTSPRLISQFRDIQFVFKPH